LSIYSLFLILKSKDFSFPALCVLLCEEYLENYFHIFFTCPTSISVWASIRLWQLIDSLILEVDSWKELVSKLCRVLDDSKVCTFVMTMWSLWSRRNTVNGGTLWWSSANCSSFNVMHMVDNIVAVTWSNPPVLNRKMKRHQEFLMAINK